MQFSPTIIPSDSEVRHTMKNDEEVYSRLLSAMISNGQWNLRTDDPESILGALELFCKGEIDDVDNRIVRTNSPWHASVWLILYSLLLSDVTFMPDVRASMAQKLGMKELGISISIFRGQGMVDWDFIPSNEHPTLKTPEAKRSASMATKLFENLLHKALSHHHWPRFNDECYTAVAQHYGLRTKYLDFTTDPSVAVFFALQQAKSAGSSHAVVYMAPLMSVLPMIRLILPPPEMERIYLQRGLFVEMKKEDRIEFRKRCRMVIFPVDHSFQIIRRNTGSGTPETINLLPSLPILDSMKLKAEEMILTNGGMMLKADTAEQLTDDCFESLNLRTQFPAVSDAAIDNWWHAMMMYLREMVYHDRDKQVGIDVLRNLAQLNESMLHIIMKVLSTGDPSSESGSANIRLAELIAQALVDVWHKAGRMELTPEQQRVLDMQFRPEGILPDDRDQQMPEINEENVRKRAFAIWISTGATDGHDKDDWFQARECLPAELEPQEPPIMQTVKLQELGHWHQWHLDVDSWLTVVAPHGGNIEPHTTFIARRIAGAEFNLFSFEGLIADEQDCYVRLHKKSTEYRDANLRKLQEKSLVTMSIHGKIGQNGVDMTWVGGLNRRLREAVTQKLVDYGFAAIDAVAEDVRNYKGVSTDNFVNMYTRGKGVQLEISRSLRDRLSQEPQLMDSYVEAVREALIINRTFLEDECKPVLTP